MPDTTGKRPSTVDGPDISVAVIDATTDSGDHNIVVASATQTLKIYKVFISPDADVTGDVTLKVGSTTIGKIRDPIVGGNHIIFSGATYYQGALGEDLVLGTGSATDITVTSVYEVF